METKPFNLQSPEKIAAEYGGNKQKIASATQLGLVDPTAALLAGMFIDRMRSAQVQEQKPQQTIAQQVFAPPQGMPPQGMPPQGAPPQGMPPQGAPPPPQGMPPQGMPPQGMPPQGMPPQGAPPAMMADGGLASLPVPDGMFDEPADTGYSGGGIVAFADAGPVGTGPLVDPNYERDVRSYADINTKMLGDAQGPAMKEMIAENARIRSPEGAAAQKKQDMWATLAQIGATMASTPGSFLQGVGAGVNKALPEAIEQNKARKAEQRAALQSSATMETAQYSAKAAAMQNAQKMYADAKELARLGRKDEADAKFREAQIAADYARINSSEKIARDQIAAQREGYNRLTGEERLIADYTKGLKPGTPEYRAAVRELKSASTYGRMANSNFSTDMDDARKAVDASKQGTLKRTNPTAYNQAVNAEYMRINQAREMATGGAGAGAAGSVSGSSPPWAKNYTPQ